MKIYEMYYDEDYYQNIIFRLDKKSDVDILSMMVDDILAASCFWVDTNFEIRIKRKLHLKIGFNALTRRAELSLFQNKKQLYYSYQDR